MWLSCTESKQQIKSREDSPEFVGLIDLEEADHDSRDNRENKGKALRDNVPDVLFELSLLNHRLSK